MKAIMLAGLLALMGCTVNQDLGSSQSGIAAYVGVWEGYIENYQFLSGSDHIKITITAEGDEVSGTVQFGEGEPPPPPVDPNAYYPPEPKGYAFNPNDVAEGFEYSVQQADLTDQRLQFKVSSFELWTDWCELQKSYSWGGDDYGCVGGELGSDEQGCYVSTEAGKVYFDCRNMDLCSTGPCTCTAEGCTVPPGDYLNVSLDMVVRDDLADGSVAGIEPDSVHNLRLTRAR